MSSGTRQVRTGAERYFQERRQDPEYGAAYERARRRTDDVDRIIRMIDEQRIALGLTKAELARRVGTRPESIRRLLSSSHANPTLNTVVALANELDLDLVAVPAEGSGSDKPNDHDSGPLTTSRSDGSGIRRRTA